MIGVGLIGAGKHGQRYLSHIRADVPELRIVALSRQDAGAGEAQAREIGCRFHADWAALVADPAVDAVAVVVPPSLHPAVVRGVAAAGKALLIEKPLATTAAAAVEIVREVRRAGIPALMAHTLRWNSVVSALRDRLPTLGALRAVYLNQRFEPSPLDWLDQPERSGGGIMLHTGVHSFDLVRHLTGRNVTRVWCRTARAVTQRTEDNFTALLELEGDDALVTVNGCRATQGRSGLIDLAGAEGQLVGDHYLGFAYAVRGGARSPIEIGPPAPTVREALRAFVRLVRDGERPAADLEDGAHAVAIAEACYRAAATGAPVAVET